jgi:Tol biopolymer transport system component
MRHIVKLALTVALATALATPDSAQAGSCTTNLTPQPSSSLPGLTGQMAFQALLVTPNQTHIFYYDFANPSQGRVQLDATFGMTIAINPSFSSDGKWLVFTGATSSCGSSQTIYAYNIARQVLSTLIPCDSNSREDVRFWPDQSKVVFKLLTSPTSHNIAYAPITLNPTTGQASLGGVCLVTNDSTEHSAPSVSPSGKYIYYYNGVATAANIYRSPYSATCNAITTPQQVTASGNSAYFPVARDLSTLLYTRHTTQTNAYDQIFVIQPDLFGATETQLNLNNCTSDNSDPASVDENYILFSRDGTSGIYLGNVMTSDIWSLQAQLQPSNLPAIANLLGSTYSNNR